MTPDEWKQTMAFYAAIWPNAAPNPATVNAWYTFGYGHEPQNQILDAYGLLSRDPTRIFPPDVNAVARALAEIRRPRPAVYVPPPELPASTDPVVLRNQRRLRVIGKLGMGALDRDGNPTEGWENDPDLTDDGADPLLPEMIAAHLTARRRHIAS